MPHICRRKSHKTFQMKDAHVSSTSQLGRPPGPRFRHEAILFLSPSSFSGSGEKVLKRVIIQSHAATGCPATHRKGGGNNVLHFLNAFLRPKNITEKAMQMVEKGKGTIWYIALAMCAHKTITNSKKLQWVWTRNGHISYEKMFQQEEMRIRWRKKNIGKYLPVYISRIEGLKVTETKEKSIRFMGINPFSRIPWPPNNEILENNFQL